MNAGRLSGRSFIFVYAVVLYSIVMPMLICDYVDPGLTGMTLTYVT
jgi:hypothetical protein